MEYIVKDGAVAIIDAFSGRVLDGRRFTDGLQQSIEAKEKITVSISQIRHVFSSLLSVSAQNFLPLIEMVCFLEFHHRYNSISKTENSVS